MTHRMLAAGNNAAAWVYRRTRGRIGGSAKGVPVLLLTVAGRKTQIPRTVPVAYFKHGDGYLVAASAGGAKAEPQWIRNIGAAGTAHITVSEDQYDVDARVPHSAERDKLWQEVVLAQAPFFAKYEEKSGRTIPIALLVPNDPPDHRTQGTDDLI
ncbi:MAG TPA: nitroreductase/quinone reductase family protein [Acidimicrobiia bacterium]|nr:nitroreductase/quinone reductase family protein [Acidimicrobiia bacterium]